MDFSHYYQGELDYLLEMGRSFSQKHASARHLAERSGDPDVERLLEGVAFLCAKVHQRIDYSTPQLVHRVAELLTPQHLRPIPSSTILQFQPDLHALSAPREIPLHTQVWSRPVQGEPCRFRSTQPITVLPVCLQSARCESHGTHKKLVLELQTNSAGQTLIAEHGQLDFYVHGESSLASTLLLWLARHCNKVRILDYEHTPEHAPRSSAGLVSRQILGPENVRLTGFENPHPLAAWGPLALASHRLIAEYFTLPHKFRTFSLTGLEGLALKDTRFRIELDLDSPPELAGNVDASIFCLHTTPALNLFPVSAEPICHSPLAPPRMLRASGLAPHAFEVFEVMQVQGQTQGHGGPKPYPPLNHFDTSCEPGAAFVLERKVCPLDDRLDTYLRVLKGTHDKAPLKEILSAELLCTNRTLAHELKVAEICHPARGENLDLAVHNLVAPTKSSRPPLEKELQWRLSAQLGLSRTSMASLAPLRALLDLYNEQGRIKSSQGQANAQLIAALHKVALEPSTRLVMGAPVLGSKINITLDPAKLCAGQAFMFGQLLSAVMSAHVPLNSFNETCLKLGDTKQSWSFAPRDGQGVLI